MSVRIHLEVRSPAKGEIDTRAGDYKVSIDAEYDTAAGAIRVGRDVLDRLEAWLAEGHRRPTPTSTGSVSPPTGRWGRWKGARMGEPKPDWQVRAEEHRRERWTKLISKEVRQRILDRDYPGRLVWPDPCPVDAGDEIPLHRDVTVIVNRPRPIDKQDHSQGWRTTYTVRDLRPEFLLRRVPPGRPPRRDELDADGYVPPPGPATAAKARIESHYTSSIAQAVPESEEGVDPDWHDRGKEQRELTRLEAVKEEKRRGLIEKKIRQAKARMSMIGAWEIQHGIDAGPALDRILAELEALDPAADRAMEKAA